MEDYSVEARVVPPSGPWQDYSADLLGPLPSGENNLVVVDYHRRYCEIEILRSTTSAKVIEAVRPILNFVRRAKFVENGQWSSVCIVGVR